MKLNLVTLCNTNLLPNINKFSEEFIKYIIVFLINFFSKYNQLTLDFKYQDIIVFNTLLKLLKIMTLP